MKRKVLAGYLVGFTLLASTTGCFGKFGLTRAVWNLNNFNGSMDNIFGRFLKTIVMYIFAFLPVYGIASFLDLVLFNLIEFWTGKNLLAGQNSFDTDGSATAFAKNFEKGDMRLNMQFDPATKDVQISVFKAGVLQNQTVVHYPQGGIASMSILDVKTGLVAERREVLGDVSAAGLKVAEMELEAGNTKGAIETLIQAAFDSGKTATVASFR